MRSTWSASPSGSSGPVRRRPNRRADRGAPGWVFGMSIPTTATTVFLSYAQLTIAGTAMWFYESTVQQ